MVFYYLREFSSDNNFNKLTIEERLILSALLTKKLNNDDRDLVEIIMNFNNNIDYTNYTSWANYKIFSEIITKFLEEAKGHISDYVIRNIEDRGLLHYVTINYEDLKVHQKNSFSNLACKAFILGCANHSCNDNNNWFSFNIQKWNKFALTHKKRTLEDIKNFMDQFNINYSINGNKVTISNKREQKQLTEAVEKNGAAKQKSVKKELQEIPKKIEKIIDENVDVFNLGEHRLNKEMIVDYINENSYKISNFDFQKYTELFREFQNSKTYKNYITKLLGNGSKDIPKVYENKDVYFEGDDGLERKKNACYQIKEVQSAVINALNKVYDFDKDHSRYIAILNFVCKNYSPLFTNF